MIYDLSRHHIITIKARPLPTGRQAAEAVVIQDTTHDVEFSAVGTEHCPVLFLRGHKIKKTQNISALL